MIKLALALIVKPTDEEAESLKKALKYTAPYVDGIFITITGKNKKCEEVAKLYNANVSYFKWIDDFASARNYNFSQVPKEYDYILWMDSDDAFRGIENLRDIIEKNKDTDGFAMNYLYWFDKDGNPEVVHLKTQVIRNDGCVKWVGWLHEDFSQNRLLKIKFVKNVERIHLSDEDRSKIASKRNLDICRKWVKKDSNDPRTYWNLGNAAKGYGRLDESMRAFNKFLKMSRSDDEKYIVYLRMAEIYFQKENYIKALEVIRQAIGTKPDYPDAYYLQGRIYFKLKDFYKAKDSYILGLKQKPPIYNIIVYNPREYDYIPLKALANIYFELNMPQLAKVLLESCLKINPHDKSVKKLISIMKKESKRVNTVLKSLEKLNKITNKIKLKKELEKLPNDIKSHPAICRLRNQNFLKTKSTGKDLIFYCGYTAEEWTPESVKKTGIGGSEEAIINLSKGLKEKGWNVTVYNNCGYKEQVFDGVTYKPFWIWNPEDKEDVVIIWRHPRPVDYNINANKIYIDLHDTISEGEFTKDRLDKISGIFLKSNAHRKLYPNIPDDKIVIIPNGVDLSLFDIKVERDPYYLVNFSSPDRSLSASLDIIEELVDKLPKDIASKVKFGWFYGWGVFNSSRNSKEEQTWKSNLIKRFETLKKKGLVIGGDRISHKQVAFENLKAGVLLYPSEFYEIDWIGGSKAQIAGCLPITTDFAAIGDKVQHGIKIHTNIGNKWDKDVLCDFSVKSEKIKKEFVKELLDYFKDVDKISRSEMSKWARKEFDINRVINMWNNEIKK